MAASNARDLGIKMLRARVTRGRNKLKAQSAESFCEALPAPLSPKTRNLGGQAAARGHSCCATHAHVHGNEAADDHHRSKN